MSLLTVLYKSYDYALENDMVDKADNVAGSVILPLYHNSLKSNGKNVIEVLLSNDGQVLGAEHLSKNELVIFPVSEDSVARSSGIAPHPLADNFTYLKPDGSAKNKAYLEQLSAWINYSHDDYLETVYKAVSSPDFFKQVLSNLAGKSESDVLKVFVTFKVEDYQGKKDITVSENKALHQNYIKFIRNSYKTDPSRKKIICNISGQPDYLCIKHRPLMVMARLISQITANTENYFGRLDKPEASIKIGVETSQKIHLMAKYLLENSQTCRWLGDTSYLVAWFSDDIENESNLDVTAEPYDPNVLEHINTAQNDKTKESKKAANLKTKDIVTSFINGRVEFSDDVRCYIAIFDKVSKGRVAAKYFRDLNASRLKENLKKWQDTYCWYRYSPISDREEKFTPSAYRILLSAYGVDRDDNLEVDNNKFKNAQMQNIVSAIVEGKEVPKNLCLALENNIKNRQKYKKTWLSVKQTAMAMLYPSYIAIYGTNNSKGERKNMLDRDNKDRSYLYGRLLALYERLEASCYEKESKRLTNAEKFWNAYVNQPVTINLRLRNAIKPYEKKLKFSDGKAGIYHKIREEILEVSNLLTEEYDYRKPENNRPLGPGFIFGYEGQLKEIWTKKETDKEKEDD